MTQLQRPVAPGPCRRTSASGTGVESVPYRVCGSGRVCWHDCGSNRLGSLGRYHREEGVIQCKPHILGSVHLKKNLIGRMGSRPRSSLEASSELPLEVDSILLHFRP